MNFFICSCCVHSCWPKDTTACNEKSGLNQATDVAPKSQVRDMFAGQKVTQLPAHCQCEVGLALHSSSIKVWQAWISIPVSSSTLLNHVWMVALWSLVEEKPNRKNSLSTFLAPVKCFSKKIARKQIPRYLETLWHTLVWGFSSSW